jgi:hypothetical protein
LNAKTLPEEVANRDIGRLRRYREYLDFYKGAQWTGRQGRRERRITFNYAKIMIDKVTSYVMADVNWAVDVPLERSNVQTSERADAQQAEAILYEVAEANNLAQLDLDNEIDTAVLGDGCYKVIWDTEEKRVRITAPDMQGIFVWWAGDDIGRMVKLASRYQVDRDEALRLYRYRTTADNVTITEGWTAQRFELWAGPDLIWQRRNPYGFIPFVVYPNLREPKQFWGVSDLAPILEPARELNRALSTLSLILEVSTEESAKRNRMWIEPSWSTVMLAMRPLISSRCSSGLSRASSNRSPSRIRIASAEMRAVSCICAMACRSSRLFWCASKARSSTLSASS